MLIVKKKVLKLLKKSKFESLNIERFQIIHEILKFKKKNTFDWYLNFTRFWNFNLKYLISKEFFFLKNQSLLENSI